MKQDVSFEEKTERALELGEAYLGVENGHLTRIDTETDYWEAIGSTDPPDGSFPPGLALDLDTTYCRRTLERGSSIALHDAPDQGWADDPAFEAHGLHCYHGTPLTVDGEPYGTVCFVSEEPREEPFSDGDTMFAELIARLLEHELEHALQEARLDRRSVLITVLSRVLRHNLRNAMTVVRGRVSLIAERFDGIGEISAPVIDKVDSLIRLSNTARDLESIVSTEFDRQPIDVVSLVQQVVTIVERDYPSASFTVEGPDEATVSAMPSLGTALEELIENAAKHSGENADVTVSIEVADNEVRVHVIDNGPGLPDQERKVLDEETETPLVHGSGLGLWLIYWIISDHGGTTGTDVSDDGTRMTVSLPRTTAPHSITDEEVLTRRLRQERDRFEAIFEEAFDAMLIANDDGQYIDVNESAAELLGRPKEELLGRSIDEFAPDDFERAWEEFQASDRERGTFPFVRADGTECIVEYATTPDIVPGQHLSILRDVTEREERKRQLEETKQQLEAVIDASPDPIIAVDADGVVQLWNGAAEDVFGYAEEEVIDESIHSLDLHDGEQRSAFEGRFERALGGETFRGLEVERTTNDGDHVHLSISTAPLRDADGTITGLMAVAEDVTERIEQERRYEALSKGFPDLCFILDEDGVYRDVLSSSASDDRLYAEPTELLGKSVQEVLPPAEADLIVSEVERTLETGEAQTFQYTLEVPAGKRTFEARTYPLSRAIDSKRTVSLVARDITERQERADGTVTA